MSDRADEVAERCVKAASQACADAADDGKMWTGGDDARAMLSTLRPGDHLPGGNRVISERLWQLLWIKYGPWGAHKAALLEGLSGDALSTLSGFDVDKEIWRAMLSEGRDG